MNPDVITLIGFLEMLKQFRFSLRGLFVLVAIAAVVAKLTQLPPTAGVTVCFKGNKEVLVNGEPTDVDNVLELIDLERQLRRKWDVSDRITIQFDSTFIAKIHKEPKLPDLFSHPVEIEKRPEIRIVNRPSSMITVNPNSIGLLPKLIEMRDSTQ